MKKIKILLVIFTTLLLLTACSSSNTTEKEASNETVISNKIDKEKDLTVKNVKLNDEKLKKYAESHNSENITRDFFIRTLLDKKYPVDEKLLTTKIKETKSEHNDWKKYLAQQGYTEDNVREEIRYQMQLHSLTQDSLDVSDEKLKAFYDSLPTTTKIRHLLVNDEKTANALYERIEAGEDFGKLAKKYSQDTDTAQSGGVWEQYEPGNSLDVIDQQLNQLTKEGQVTKPFQSVLGWHLLKLEAFNSKISYSKDNILPMYYQKNITSNLVQKLLDQLVEKNKDQLTKEQQKELLNTK